MLYPDLIQFIRENGPEAWEGTDQELDNELDWFLAHRRMFIVKSRGQTIALGTYMILETPSVLALDVWPWDNPDGKYIYIRMLVVDKRVRNYRVPQYMMAKLKGIFPQLEYMIFNRDTGTRVVEVNRFIEGGNNGQETRRTGTSTYATQPGSNR